MRQSGVGLLMASVGYIHRQFLIEKNI